MQIKWEAKIGIFILTFWSELIDLQCDIPLQLPSPSTGGQPRKEKAKIITYQLSLQILPVQGESTTDQESIETWERFLHLKQNHLM